MNMKLPTGEWRDGGGRTRSNIEIGEDWKIITL